MRADRITDDTLDELRRTLDELRDNESALAHTSESVFANGMRAAFIRTGEALDVLNRELGGIDESDLAKFEDVLREQIELGERETREGLSESTEQYGEGRRTVAARMLEALNDLIGADDDPPIGYTDEGELVEQFVESDGEEVAA